MNFNLRPCLNINGCFIDPLSVFFARLAEKQCSTTPSPKKKLAEKQCSTTTPSPKKKLKSSKGGKHIPIDAFFAKCKKNL